MSYMKYYSHNVYDKSYNHEIVRGLCHSMCPEDEINLRVRERLVHVLEMCGPEKKLIKCYSRSAADSTMAIPKLLRPYSVLEQTVDYLLFNVVKRDDVSLIVLYDFINDRLRAVRQDMTIQRLPAKECVKLLGPMIRFYTYFGYKLSDHPDFDLVLNKKHLLECIKWYLSQSDSIEKNYKDPNINELSTLLDSMNIASKGKENLSSDRALIESIYILCNLDDSSPLLRYLELPEYLKREPMVEMAFKLAISNLKRNFILAIKMVEKLCPLLYCAVSLHLPVLQRRALQIMSVAYNSKRLSFPLAILQKWLHLSSKAEAARMCQHYGLHVENMAVIFVNSNFKTNADVIRTEKNYLHLEKLNMITDFIFTYTKSCF